MGLGAPCRQCDVFEVMRLDIRPPSDQMIRQAAAGDQEAFACLTRRMMPLLRSQINGLGSSGTDEDDDLFQEAMLGLLAAVRSYRPEAGASFTTYATVCVRHRLLSALRRLRSLFPGKTAAPAVRGSRHTYDASVPFFRGDNSLVIMGVPLC